MLGHLAIDVERFWFRAITAAEPARIPSGHRGLASQKAITAIAHTLLKIAYQVLKSGTPYQELGADFYTRRESPEQEQPDWNASCKNSTPAAPAPLPSALRRPPYHLALNLQS